MAATHDVICPACCESLTGRSSSYVLLACCHPLCLECLEGELRDEDAGEGVPKCTFRIDETLSCGTPLWPCGTSRAAAARDKDALFLFVGPSTTAAAAAAADDDDDGEGEGDPVELTHKAMQALAKTVRVQRIDAFTRAIEGLTACVEGLRRRLAQLGAEVDRYFEQVSSLSAPSNGGGVKRVKRVAQLSRPLRTRKDEVLETIEGEVRPNVQAAVKALLDQRDTLLVLLHQQVAAATSLEVAASDGSCHSVCKRVLAQASAVVKTDVTRSLVVPSTLDIDLDMSNVPFTDRGNLSNAKLKHLGQLVRRLTLVNGASLLPLPWLNLNYMGAIKELKRPFLGELEKLVTSRLSCLAHDPLRNYALCGHQHRKALQIVSLSEERVEGVLSASGRIHAVCVLNTGEYVVFVGGENAGLPGRLEYYNSETHLLLKTVQTSDVYVVDCVLVPLPGGSVIVSLRKSVAKTEGEAVSCYGPDGLLRWRSDKERDGSSRYFSAYALFDDETLITTATGRTLTPVSIASGQFGDPIVLALNMYSFTSAFCPGGLAMDKSADVLLVCFREGLVALKFNSHFKAPSLHFVWLTSRNMFFFVSSLDNTLYNFKETRWDSGPGGFIPFTFVSG